MNKIKFWKIKLILLLFGINISRSTFRHLERKQCNKGLEKYGHNLKDCDFNKYNWRTMLIEEIIDAFYYSMKKNNKL